MTRVLEHLIEMKPIPLKLGHNHLAFINPFLEDCIKRLPLFLDEICVVQDVKLVTQEKLSDEISPTFRDYCNLVATLYNHIENVESVLQQTDIPHDKQKLTRTAPYQSSTFIDLLKSAYRVIWTGMTSMFF